MNDYKNWILKNRGSIDRLIEEGELNYWLTEHLPQSEENVVIETIPFNAILDIDCAGTDSNIQLQNALTAVFVLALSKIMGVKEIVIEKEGHGRDAIGNYDVSDVIGWFTSKFPVKYTVENDDLFLLQDKVAEINNSIPNSGVGYNVLKYLSPGYIGNRFKHTPKFSFNFLGDLSVISSGTGQGKLIKASHSTFSSSLEQKNEADRKEPYWINLNAWVENSRLKCVLAVSPQMGLNESSWLQLKEIMKEGMETLFKRTNQALPTDQLTSFQKGLVSYAKNNPESNRYVIQLHVPFEQGSSLKTFSDAFHILISRHEILRTCYDFDYETGEFTATVLAGNSLQFEEFELNEEIGSVGFISFCEHIKEKSFDISSEPLIRLAFLKLKNNERVIVVTAHHLILDGRSISILFRELSEISAELEKGKLPSGHLAKKLQFSNYVNWISLQDRDVAAAYWQKTLKDCKPTLLESETAAETISSSQPYGEYRKVFKLNPESIATLKKEGITLSAAFNFFIGLILSKYYGDSRFVWGNIITLRPADLSDAEYILGPCISTIPVTLDFGKESFVINLMKELQLQVIESSAQAHLGLQEIFNQVKGQNLFSVLYSFQSYKGHTTAPVSGNAENKAVISSHFPLTIVLEQGGESLEAVLCYRNDLFTGYALSDIMESVISGFNELLQIKSTFPSSFNLFSFPAKVLPAVLEGKQEDISGQYESLGSYFTQIANQYPDKIAVIDAEGRNYTYNEIDGMSNYIANQLIENGLRGPVGIRLSRSVNMVASVIGTIKAGCAVVSLEAEFPEEKLIWLHHELNLVAVISDTGNPVPGEYKGAYSLLLSDVIPLTVSLPLPLVQTGDLCAVNYTSGSTGNPKLVLTDHLSHLNRLHWLKSQFPLKEGDRFCLKTLLAFAPALREIFEPLTQGGVLYILLEDTSRDLEKFTSFIAGNKITRLFLTPTFLQLIMDNGKEECLKQLYYLEISGEPATIALVEILQTALPGVTILNRYGATEAASVVYNYRGVKESAERGLKYFQLGVPICNTKVSVVDQSMRIKPRGVIGEILIQSDSLAKGYSDIANEEGAFLKNAGSRDILKTGDLGFVNDTGELCYHGRITRMIKVRGYRIEPREIEYNLEVHPAIRKAVVVSVTVGDNQQIIAFCVPVEKSAADNTADLGLKVFLQQRIPAYMIPQEIRMIEQIPVTSSGKIDFVALKGLVDIAGQEEIINAGTDTEKELAGLIGNLTGHRKLDVSADFFETGLDSILVLRVIHKIRMEMGVIITLSSFYELNSIKKLAAHIDTVKATGTQQQYYTMNFQQENDFLFLFPPGGGNSLVYKELEPFLPGGLTAVAFDAFTPADGKEKDISLETMATYYTDKVVQIAGDRCVSISGWSMGGTIAFEVARQLELRGVEIKAVVLIDPAFNTSDYDDHISKDKLRLLLEELLDDNEIVLKEDTLDRMYLDSSLVRNYAPGLYKGDIYLIKPTEILEAERNFEKPFNGLEKFCLGDIDVTEVPGNHFTMIGSTLGSTVNEIFKELVQ